MSIEVNWDTFTSGPDGEALAERIRSFIHDKFQTVPLPRFIRSVTVQGFAFGSIPPQLDLKDMTDPLPDFYDVDLDEDDDESEEEEQDHHMSMSHDSSSFHERGARLGESGDTRRQRGMRSEVLRGEMGGHDLGSPFLGTSTPGILGTPGLAYFQGHLGGTGSQTPLAAVAGAHLGNSWMQEHPDHSPSSSHSRHPSHSSIVSVDNFSGGLTVPPQPQQQGGLREKSSVSTLAPTSAGTSRPPTRDTHLGGSAIVDEDEDEDEDHGNQGGNERGHGGPDGDEEHSSQRRRREPRVEDVQAVFRIRYSGDVRLNLTAEILLDYPMPSFVGIPLKLSITGLSFDGVGVLAYIRKRVHFCFLSPEDAHAAVGPDEEDEHHAGEAGAHHDGHHKPRFGGLLQQIKVESEIGERDGGKQSLKNVGKVERFVLEQVRRIFEEEFVYPSFWTFLV